MTTARGVAGAVRGLIARNKLVVAITAVFVVFVVVVVVSANTGGPAPGTPAARRDPPAPDFTVAVLAIPGRDSGGQHITLSRQYAGQPVIVNFWASWCEPCQQETPLLARWYRQHPAVNLIGLDENDSAASARAFAKARGVTYPLGFDPRTQVAGAYGVAGAGIPQTFFLDAKHRIVDHVYGAVTAADLARGVTLMRG